MAYTNHARPEGLKDRPPCPIKVLSPTPNRRPVWRPVPEGGDAGRNRSRKPDVGRVGWRRRTADLQCPDGRSFGFRDRPQPVLGSAGGRRSLSSFGRGDVVVVLFPFSIGMNAKTRPAVVVSPIPFGNGHDYLLCLMTMTAQPGEPNLLPVSATDFEPGAAYNGSGFVRPTVLFTMDGGQVNKCIGRLNAAMIEKVMAPVRALVA
ncbi:MAG: hypothetical protein EOP08_00260 [Proteobacteria bacterium]|nr:MAG: hypothetical protein EOP08_00260 [Pseudomonadota bacterium]